MDTYDNIKTGMVLCDGERAGGYAFVCRGHVYTCKGCGNTGCRQTKDGGCNKQAFNVSFKCLKCGALGQQEATTVDYTQTQQWLNPDQNTHS
ncbi:MAG: hypothetical protein WC782_16295 [Methylococcaceae bacterium]|jgi:hypothetical protein